MLSKPKAVVVDPLLTPERAPMNSNSVQRLLLVSLMAVAGLLRAAETTLLAPGAKIT